MCADNRIVSKKFKTFWSNLEHLSVFKAPWGAIQEHKSGTVHKSNPEHLVFQDPQFQSETPPCF